MAFVARVPDWFQTRVAAQVVAFFALKAGGKINILRLTKLVYLSDRASMKERDRPITGDNFVSMPFGPVNTYMYSYMNGEARGVNDFSWHEFVGARENYEVPLSRPDIGFDDLDELSKSDVRILGATWDRFSDIDKYELAEWTHDFCPEWRNPHGSSLPINFSTVFKRLDKREPLELDEEIQQERALSLEYKRN